MPAEERVAVGLVHGLHGLRGAVRVEVLSDEPERFSVGSVVFVEGDERPLTIAWVGSAKAGLLVRFEDVPDRESAEFLRGRYLEVTAPPSLPAGTYYWHELEDLAVTTTGGEALGSVVDVFRAGEAEVYVVRGGALGEILVPAVSNVVVELDPRAGRLVVDPVALDLPAAPPRRRRRQEVTRRQRKAARAARAAARSREREAPAAGAGGVPPATEEQEASTAGEPLEPSDGATDPAPAS